MNLSGDADLIAGKPCLWINPARQPAQTALPGLPIGPPDIEAADARLRRFAPLLTMLFPELSASGGLIESELIDASALRQALVGDAAEYGRWLIKGDHALPVAGSIKARGGIHEVLEFAERLAIEQGLIDRGGDCTDLAAPTARRVFARYTIAVGSTGNLGLSIGVIASALGFNAVVHMSADAKPWKKERLRKRGVSVVEHMGDYGSAVEQGRREADADPNSYFVDDERSLSLFLGYAVAALRLRDQLAQSGIGVGPQAPLFVYLPCGVGGAPAGITFGLKQVFGDSVHCFFAEPTAAPCFMAQMRHPEWPGLSIHELGLDNRTDADGLAVAVASELAVRMMRPLLSGNFTVEDDDLFRHLYLLHQTENLNIEPSAAAGFNGPAMLLNTSAGRRYLADNGLQNLLPQAVHLLWTTGGLFVPDDEYRGFLQRGRSLA